MKYSNEIVVGLSLALAAVILVVGVRFLEDVPLFRGTHDLTTAFDDAGGLMNGNSVRVQGVRVGQIDDVRFDPESGRVLVRFHVDRDVPITEGSFTTLGGMSVLGTVHMNVELGPATTARVPESGFIPSRPEPDIFETLTQRAPRLVEDVERVLVTANETLEHAELLFRDASVDTRQALQSFRQATARLDGMLQHEQEGVSRIVSNVERFSANVSRFSEETTDTLSLAVERMNRSMARLDRSLETLEGSMATLDGILLSVGEGDGTLARLINDPAVFERMDSTLHALQSLIDEVRADPGRYLRHMTMIRVF